MHDPAPVPSRGRQTRAILNLTPHIPHTNRILQLPDSTPDAIPIPNPFPKRSPQTPPPAVRSPARACACSEPYSPVITCPEEARQHEAVRAYVSSLHPASGRSPSASVAASSVPLPPLPSCPQVSMYYVHNRPLAHARRTCAATCGDFCCLRQKQSVHGITLHRSLPSWGQHFTAYVLAAPEPEEED